MSCRSNVSTFTDDVGQLNNDATKKGRLDSTGGHDRVGQQGRRRSAVRPPGPNTTPEESSCINVIVKRSTGHDTAAGD